jgi:hypothetical protein
MNSTPDTLPIGAPVPPPGESCATTRSPIAGTVQGRWFYFGLSLALSLIAVAGFMPSYLIKVGNHSFDLPPIFHVHACLFFSWLFLNALQAWFVATGRVYNHRNWGLAGISLATAMTISIVLLVITGIKLAEAHGMGLVARRFAYLNVSGAAKFAVFFGAAIACIKRRELHKRLMVIANSTVMGAPVGRLVVMAMVPPNLRVGPPPSLAILLILVLAYFPTYAGMVHDWRTRGRPHPVYLVGLLSMLSGLLVPVIGRTDAWMNVINHLVLLMG